MWILQYKKIYFIRHAESSANKGKVSKPNAEVELTELGHNQAKILADNWQEKPSHIFVSAYKRTQQTAQPLAKKFQLTPSVISQLNEFNTFSYELVEGLTGEQRLPLAMNYWKEADPDKRYGEHAQTFNEFCQQVGSAKSTIRDLPNGSVVFGHGMWLAVFMWQALGYGRSVESHLTMRRFFKLRTGLYIPNIAKYQMFICDDEIFVEYKGNMPSQVSD